MLDRDGVGEQEAVLHDEPDRGAQRVLGDVPYVVAADPDGAPAHVVEPRQQQRDRRLAGAGGADHGHRLARADAQREPAQHRLGRHVAEPDVVEFDAGRVGRQRRGAGLVGDHRARVDDFQHPDDAGPRLLPDRDQGGEHPDRAGHLREVAGEGQERAERDAALDGEPAAQGEHPDLAEGGDGLQRGVEPGHHAREPDAGRVQVRARALHALQFLVFLPEALDHADPADGLVDDGRDLARLLLRVPARREQLAPGPQRDHPQRRGDRQRHHGQQRRQGQHDDDRDDEEQRAADGDRQERQQRPGSC